MADVRTIVDEERVDEEAGRVQRITVHETTDETYPCGYKYTFHYGTLDGETLLRYDNAHERQKGHERHTSEGVETIDFPGLVSLWRRWEREIADL